MTHLEMLPYDKKLAVAPTCIDRTRTNIDNVVRLVLASLTTLSKNSAT